MMVHTPARLFVTWCGLGFLFFLSAAQVGLLVGWCNTTSAIIRHADAAVWIMAEQTPAFDYGTAIPAQRVHQARSVEGVAWAEGMFMAWNTWQRPDGRRVNIELVGLDSSCVGGPWTMQRGRVEEVHLPDSVIVDELFLDSLGVAATGDEGEMYSRRAVVRGISANVRTFTASPFVFTSLRSARRYDKRYGSDEVTYVLVRCAPGHCPEEVRDRLRAALPFVEVLTRDEFAGRTMRYWMLDTGLGITVVLTAVLGLAVSVVITSQTLYAMTQEYLGNYATLAAIGFGRLQLFACVVFQSLILSAGGTAIGSVSFFAIARLSARTPVPLETTPVVFACLAAGSLASSLLGALLSIRAVVRLDPAVVFRG